VEVICSEKSYWVAGELAESFINSCGLQACEFGEKLLGSEMTSWVTQHPFIDRESPVVSAEYVTTESGTGCVHIAPGHGLDDYITGLENKLEVYCPLDDNGCYVDDGQIPSNLVGVSVLEKASGCPANKEVLSILRESGKLLAQTDHAHQYPHCWRSKTPVVFRAMDQWFVALDKDELRKKCMEEVQSVNFTPDWGKNRIHGFLQSRPDWCISRQRSWGVPIPVFYDEEGEALLDEKLILGLADKIEKLGTDAWFSLSENELLDGLPIPADWKGRTLHKGTDTLDVWIDSGCSHRAVLQNNKDLKWPADLYLEGSDQHRGWFQSSLWTSMIAFEQAPYKRVLTHGFVVDGNGRKISKSDGKPQTADSYVKKYGADVLRIWVCSEDFRRDIPLSDEILGQVVRSYRTLRNSIKFQLGNLHDFTFSEDAIPVQQLTIIDRWALGQTNSLIKEVTEAFEKYEFHRGVQAINKFCSNVLSSTYHDIIKDRLYTLHPSDSKRRSTQTALHLIFESLIRILGPMAPFTADEAWSFHQSGKDITADFLALQAWPKVTEEWDEGKELSDAQTILDFKDLKVNDSLESLRTRKEIGQSLEAEIEIRIPLSESLLTLFRHREEDLAEMFIVSNVLIVEVSEDEELQVISRHASGQRCPRSWRWVPKLVSIEPWGEVSPRCAEVLAKLV
jgi:isoleucyl-tRNA synthetase